MEQRPYSELGDVLFDLARKRQIRGPYNVHAFMERRMLEVGLDPTDLPRGQTVSKYFYGSRPNERFVLLFADLFELTAEERGLLAWIYAYGFPAAA